jgi:hypothetical protein
VARGLEKGALEDMGIDLVALNGKRFPHQVLNLNVGELRIGGGHHGRRFSHSRGRL